MQTNYEASSDSILVKNLTKEEQLIWDFKFFHPKSAEELWTLFLENNPKYPITAEDQFFSLVSRENLHPYPLSMDDCWTILFSHEEKLPRALSASFILDEMMHVDLFILGLIYSCLDPEEPMAKHVSKVIKQWEDCFWVPSDMDAYETSKRQEIAILKTEDEFIHALLNTFQRKGVTSTKMCTALVSELLPVDSQLIIANALWDLRSVSYSLEDFVLDWALKGASSKNPAVQQFIKKKKKEMFDDQYSEEFNLIKQEEDRVDNYEALEHSLS